MSPPTGTLASEPVSASTHAVRYEALRDQAIGHHGVIVRHGLAVLLRQGVAAWMDAWSRVPPPAPRSLTQAKPCALPDESSTEVVRVLVAMTLGQLQQVSA